MQKSASHGSFQNLSTAPSMSAATAATPTDSRTPPLVPAWQSLWILLPPTYPLFKGFCTPSNITPNTAAAGTNAAAPSQSQAQTPTQSQGHKGHTSTQSSPSQRTELASETPVAMFLSDGDSYCHPQGIAARTLLQVTPGLSGCIARHLSCQTL